MALTKKTAVQGWLKKARGSSGKDALWELAKENYDIGMELKLPYVGRWLLSLSFIAGKQYATYSNATHLLQHLVAPKGRVRVVATSCGPEGQGSGCG